MGDAAAWETRLAGIERLVNLSCPAIVVFDGVGQSPEYEGLGVREVSQCEYQLAGQKNLDEDFGDLASHRRKVGTGNKRCNPSCYREA